MYALTISANDYPEANYYISEFQDYGPGRQLIIKVGGALVNDEFELQALAESLYTLKKHSIGAVIIHGGGPQMNKRMEDKNIESKFIDGKRFTDQATLDIATEVFCGISQKIVNRLKAYNINATVVPGNHIVEAHRNPALGLVGDKVKAVDSAQLQQEAEVCDVVVVNSLARDEENSKQVLNINADTVFKEVVFSMAPHRLVSLTSVGGIFEDPNDSESILDSLDVKDIEQLIKDDIISGGMAMKVRELGDIVNVLPPGSAISITKPSQLIDELFSRPGSGTYIANGPKLEWYSDWHNQKDAIRNIISRSFGTELPEEYFELTKPVSLILTHDLSGCAIVSLLEDGSVYLDKLAVIPESQGRGIAQHLWYALTAKYPKIIWRARSNNPFVKWYQDNADYYVGYGEWSIFSIGYDLKHIEQNSKEILEKPAIG
ncbi:hypothetical protein KBC31_01650 [Candidatus Saccharibacteria bacterium]|nr:hypothetical protein [Candidatus Saccharibacteria bacterium]